MEKISKLIFLILVFNSIFSIHNSDKKIKAKEKERWIAMMKQEEPTPLNEQKLRIEQLKLRSQELELQYLQLEVKITQAKERQKEASDKLVCIQKN